jgi:hypothetical protein
VMKRRNKKGGKNKRTEEREKKRTLSRGRSSCRKLARQPFFFSFFSSAPDPHLDSSRVT